MSAEGEPTWRLPECIRETVRWCRQWNEGHADLRALCEEQIDEYTRCAAGRGMIWALDGIETCAYLPWHRTCIPARAARRGSSWGR